MVARETQRGYPSWSRRPRVWFAAENTKETKGLEGTSRKQAKADTGPPSTKVHFHPRFARPHPSLAGAIHP